MGFYYDPRIPELALVGAQMKLPEIQRDEIDLLDQSILWNTPKKRKTTEKRMKARYGMKEWGTWKPYVKNKKPSVLSYRKIKNLQYFMKTKHMKIQARMIR